VDTATYLDALREELRGDEQRLGRALKEHAAGSMSDLQVEHAKGKLAGTAAEVKRVSARLAAERKAAKPKPKGRKPAATRRRAA
jgi:hypothetical protein